MSLLTDPDLAQRSREARRNRLAPRTLRSLRETDRWLEPPKSCVSRRVAKTLRPDAHEAFDLGFGGWTEVDRFGLQALLGFQGIFLVFVRRVEHVAAEFLFHLGVADAEALLEEDLAHRLRLQARGQGRQRLLVAQLVSEQAEVHQRVGLLGPGAVGRRRRAVLAPGGKE